MRSSTTSATTASASATVSHIAEVADANRDNLRLKLQDDAKDRWRYLWGLLNGRDSECLHEPFGSTEC